MISIKNIISSLICKKWWVSKKLGKLHFSYNKTIEDFNKFKINLNGQLGWPSSTKKIVKVKVSLTMITKEGVNVKNYFR